MSDTAPAGYNIGPATEADVDGARTVMLDTFYREFGIGYRPMWHRDVVDIDGHYLRPPRHALFVARHGGEVVATAGVRAEGPRCPPHPAWLGRRYPNGTTAQLFRVYVSPEHRRRGLARLLVARACDFVVRTPGYTALYLHTDDRTPGAAGFWRSVAKEVHDARDGDTTRPQSIHFEIPIPVAAAPAPA
ncbi:GNAT family N-acetyltransferase [Salinactinospora qingdaonensis]|uniref:GNAT family N-acetyltransferase n=1 Tax=Salinactinospora qingdaonensis TaxID=702744 RepID=A0ABP7GIL8_9ACTN